MTSYIIRPWRHMTKCICTKDLSRRHRWFAGALRQCVAKDSQSHGFLKCVVQVPLVDQSHYLNKQTSKLDKHTKAKIWKKIVQNCSNIKQNKTLEMQAKILFALVFGALALACVLSVEAKKVAWPCMEIKFPKDPQRNIAALNMCRICCHTHSFNDYRASHSGPDAMCICRQV